MGGGAQPIHTTTRAFGSKNPCPPRNPDAGLGGRRQSLLTALAFPRRTRLRTSSWWAGSPGITLTSHPSDLAMYQTRGPADVARAPIFCGTGRGHCCSCNIHEPCGILGGCAHLPPLPRQSGEGSCPLLFSCSFGPGFPVRHVPFQPAFLSSRTFLAHGSPVKPCFCGQGPCESNLPIPSVGISLLSAARARKHPKNVSPNTDPPWNGLAVFFGVFV